MSEYRYRIVESPDTGFFTYVIEDVDGFAWVSSRQTYPTREQAESSAAAAVKTYVANVSTGELPTGVVSLDGVRKRSIGINAGPNMSLYSLLGRYGIDVQSRCYAIPVSDDMSEADRQVVADAFSDIVGYYEDQTRLLKSVIEKLSDEHPEIADKL